MGKLGAKYRKVSTSGGKLRADYISGEVKVNGIKTNADGVSTFSGQLNVSELNGLSVEVKDGALYLDGKRVLLDDKT